MDHHQPASRYQVLHNEDDPPEPSAAEQPSTSTTETAQTPQTAALSEADTSPPPYCSISVEAAATSETHNEFYPVPPPYSVATSLPTYDEAEKAKAAAMAAAAAEVAQRFFSQAKSQKNPNTAPATKKKKKLLLLLNPGQTAFEMHLKSY